MMTSTGTFLTILGLSFSSRTHGLSPNNDGAISPPPPTLSSINIAKSAPPSLTQTCRQQRVPLDRRAGQDLRHALYAYNHADWYVNEVLDYASQYATAAETATTPAFPASVVESARTWLGISYVFGAAHAPALTVRAWSSWCTASLASIYAGPRRSNSAQSSTSMSANSNPAAWCSFRTRTCPASATWAFTKGPG
jgi:hypothetical protein